MSAVWSTILRLISSGTLWSKHRLPASIWNVAIFLRFAGISERQLFVSPKTSTASGWSSPNRASAAIHAQFVNLLLGPNVEKFTYGGDASIKYPSLDSSEKEWVEAIFFRKNIYGPQLETWHHANGCRMWLEVERSTKTHEIYSVKPCHPKMKKVLEKKDSNDL